MNLKRLLGFACAIAVYLPCIPLLYAQSSGSITPGVPTPVSIAVVGQSSQLSFNGAAGQLVNIQLSSESFSVDCSSVALSILNPDGSSLWSGNSCAAFLSNPPSLQTAGTYALVVNPQGGTGSATITLSLFAPPTSSSTSLPTSTQTAAVISSPGQVAEFAFNASAGLSAGLQITNSTLTNSCSVYAAVVGPDGTTLAALSTSSSSFYLNPPPLSVSGAYSLILAPQNGCTGSATVTLYLFGDQTATNISPGLATTVSIGTAGQSAQLARRWVA
jgi:hypothetical protein